jgi:hypothetical protein
MNAYTTRGEVRIQPRDISAALRTHGLAPGASLGALEKQRGWLAEAELERLLKQYGVTSTSSISLVSVLRQSIGAALVRAGERLAGSRQSRASVESNPTAGTLAAAN